MIRKMDMPIIGDGSHDNPRRPKYTDYLNKLGFRVTMVEDRKTSCTVVIREGVGQTKMRDPSVTLSIALSAMNTDITVTDRGNVTDQDVKTLQRTPMAR